jgi:uncharacterized membrane-anchored protein
MAPSMVVLTLLAGIILVPLASEYGNLRRSFALSRIGALSTTALVLPAFGMATVFALPLSAHPVAQWLATVTTTVVVYSLAARAITSSVSAAGTAPSRSTRA